MSAQWSVSERKEEGSDVSFPLQNHTTGPVRQQREALCVRVFHLHDTDSLRGQCHFSFTSLYLRYKSFPCLNDTDLSKKTLQNYARQY